MSRCQLSQMTLKRVVQFILSDGYSMIFTIETDVTKDLRPFTRAELHHKVMGTVRKKEQEAKEGMVDQSANTLTPSKKR